MASRIKTTQRMSNTSYHANGNPNWWVRVGSGPTAQFLQIDKARGDDYLDCVVDLPVGTVVYCGTGNGLHKTVRERVKTIAIDE